MTQAQSFFCDTTHLMLHPFWLIISSVFTRACTVRQMFKVWILKMMWASGHAGVCGLVWLFSGVYCHLVAAAGLSPHYMASGIVISVLSVIIEVITASSIVVSDFSPDFLTCLITSGGTHPFLQVLSSTNLYERSSWDCDVLPSSPECFDYHLTTVAFIFHIFCSSSLSPWYFLSLSCSFFLMLTLLGISPWLCLSTTAMSVSGSPTTS